jgi:hypothetical protein
MAWGSNLGGCSSQYAFSEIETTKFEIASIGGKDVLITNTPSIYKINNPGNSAPYMLFASIAGSSNSIGIRSGEFTPENTVLSIPFNGNLYSGTQIMNRTMFNAIISQKQLASYPYPN